MRGTHHRSTATVGEQLRVPLHRRPAFYILPSVHRVYNNPKGSLLNVAEQRVSIGVLSFTPLSLLLNPGTQSQTPSVACPLSCRYLPVMSPSTPPPLGDVSTDPNSKDPKTNPIPSRIVTLTLVIYESSLE